MKNEGKSKVSQDTGTKTAKDTAEGKAKRPTVPRGWKIIPNTLYPRIARIEALLGGVKRQTVRVHYQIGLLVQEVYEDVRAGGERFGPDAWKWLEAELGYEKQTLRADRLLARYFTPKEIERVCAMRAGNGSPVNCTHLRALTRVPTRKTRWELLRLVVREGLTGAQLRAVVSGFLREGDGKPGGKPRGRGLTVPATLTELLGQQDVTLAGFLRRAVVWDAAGDGLLRAAGAAPEGATSPAVQASLEQQISGFRRASAAAAERADWLERVLAELRRRQGRPTGQGLSGGEGSPGGVPIESGAVGVPMAA